jgi:hypothetical protein
MEGQLDRQLYGCEFELAKSRPRPFAVPQVTWLSALQPTFNNQNHGLYLGAGPALSFPVPVDANGDNGGATD